MKNQKTATFHTPVLLNEIVNGLKIVAGNWYVDATAGGGGHTQAILKHGGNVLAVDQDEAAIAHLHATLEQYEKGENLKIVQGNFRDLQKIVAEEKLFSVSGILFDLGMSTYQIKTSGKGFSFMNDEPLDMRMAQTTAQTAADIVNTYSETELVTVLTKYGEETLARKIVEKILLQRKIQPITTTGTLSNLITEAYKQTGKQERINPSTRTFQALRIAVNEELAALVAALPQAVDVLNTHGRLAVISFHSLEDRIVKQFFQRSVRSGDMDLVNKRPITAGDEETAVNRKARSAKLRVAEKN